MALEALRSPLPAAISTRRLEGSLVAPPSTAAVPHHLADTKLFSKASQNGVLQPKPVVVHFDGYRVGQLHKQSLRIVNVSKDSQQMHVIAPTTPFFSIKYSKQRSRLVPGLSLEVTVQFRPTEWKYYYDCIRIHCKGEHNLLVPIHGYPVMNTASFPRHVKFPPTPLGEAASRSIALHCDVPIDFDFQLSFLQPHPAFSVAPMKGVVPANGKVSIRVKFTPTDFSTATMTLQLEVSQFNSSPVVCSFTGSSTPGLAVEKLREVSPPVPRPLNPRPLISKATTEKNSSRKLPSNTTLPRAAKEDGAVVYEGISFPANLATPSAVGKVLAQQPGRMKASQLRQATAHQSGSGVSGRQLKEKLFLQEVQQTASEETANQLRWVTSLGAVLMTREEEAAVLQARAEANRDYQRHCHVAELDTEVTRCSSECVYRRSRRQVGEIPASLPTFDPYTNAPWRRRHAALRRFSQAARLVVVRQRARRRLARLQALGSLLAAGRTIEEALAEVSSSSGSSEVAAAVSVALSCSQLLPPMAAHILPLSFPRLQLGPGEGCGGGGRGEMQATVEVAVKKMVDYVSLKVPQHYRLAGYPRHALPPWGLQSYLPPGPCRPLRQGAEDELHDLGCIPGVGLELTAPASLSSEVTKVTGVTAELAVQDVEGVRGDGGGGGERLTFSPPSALHKPAPRHPLHIFEPSHGVHCYAAPLPHSEVAMDHALLPLPPSADAAGRPHPLDVIPEVMQWQAFPSHCLVSLDTSKKLVSVWRPRRSAPPSLLLPPPPCTPPQLMTGPHPDDSELMDSDDSGSPLPVPTMDMVRAQFYLPKDNGSNDESVLARTRLEEQRSNEFNQLGRRVDQRMETLLSALRDTRTSRTDDDPS